MTKKWTPDDEDRLRRALREEAAKVIPAPGGLDRIMARTRRTPGWLRELRNPVVLGMAAAVITAVAVVGAGLGMLRGGDDLTAGIGGDATTTAPQSPSPEPAPGPTAEPTPESPTYTPPAEVAPEPTPTAPSPPPAEPAPGYSGAVPVYYVTDTPAGLRLAREWRRVDAAPSAAAGAVELLFAPAQVPDYDSLWNPATEVRSVEIRDGAIEADLSPPADSDPVAPDHAELAVQQIVYTATAAVSLAGGDGTLPVRLLVDGERVGQLAGADVSTALRRANALETRLLVQLNDPYEGQTVTTPVRVRGEAAVFEATVEWEIHQDGEVVADGYATAAEAFRFSEFEFQIDLPPGEYTVVVSESDPSGGEGRPPMSDARTFVVTD